MSVDPMIRWRPLAYRIARDFYWPGGDVDDVRQEAMIALHAGLRCWKPERGPIAPHLGMVIRRHLITCLKAARREKHMILSEASPEPLPFCQEPVSTEREALARLELREVIGRLDRLSMLEARAIVGIAVGAGYEEIDANPKAADNAVQRARRKLAA